MIVTRTKSVKSAVKAVVALFTREVAETKATKANDFSLKHGYVLLFTAEKA
jgi:ATP-dependent Clp protease adapter protein ClpS